MSNRVSRGSGIFDGRDSAADGVLRAVKNSGAPDGNLKTPV